MEEEVFLDAEEEVAPRRSGRKRRSTAGSCVTPVAVKKPKTKMPMRHSPKKDPPSQPQQPPQPGSQTSAAMASMGSDQDAFWAKMGGMLGGLESRMKLETDGVKEQLGVAVETLGVLGSRVDRAERRLDGLADEVNSLVERKLASRGAVQMPSVPALDTSGPSYAMVSAGARLPKGRTTVTVSPEKKREDHYWRCRKMLRLRPIGPGDTYTEVRRFLTEHLKLGEQFMESVGPFSAQRVPAGPSAKIQGEVIVSFASTDVRDAIKGSAKNLAGKGRDYGVRLELPDHLKSAMKALQSASYEIRTKFPEARRNVLFDDETLDLVLDFSVGEGKPWKRMTSAQAMERKRRRPADGSGKVALREGELDSLLDGSDDDSEELNCG